MTQGIFVPIERLVHALDLPIPAYATVGSAGVDLLAAIEPDAALVLTPGARTLVPSGIRIALPPGFEGQVRPRSGLALRHGVTVLNAPGTLDPDYRGEVGVVLVNLGDEAFAVERGMRIAQLIVAPFVRVSWREQEVLVPSDGRGTGGFGSTGVGSGSPTD